jgi:hypothetical protein
VRNNSRQRNVSAFGIESQASKAVSLAGVLGGRHNLKEETTMFRRDFARKFAIAVVFLAGLALALPTLASETPGKKSKAIKTTFDLLQPVTIAGTQLKPGTYDVTADDTTVTLKLNDKVMVEAPVQWKDQATKSELSGAVIVSGELKEIHFGGKTRYVEIMPKSPA